MGLAIGVFFFQEGMSKEHIYSIFGEPRDTIILDADGYHRGSILLYSNHYFFLSRAGNLQTIRERP
jgi:hypothetical protein